MKKGSRIIFIIHSFHINGVLTQCLVLSRYLKSVGYDVVVIGKKGKYGDRLFRKYGIKTLFEDGGIVNKIHSSNLVSNTELIFCESLFSYNTLIKLSGVFRATTKVLRVHEEINEELIKKNLWQNTFTDNLQEVFKQFDLTIFPSKHTADFYSEQIKQNKLSIIPITINEDIVNHRHSKDGIFRVLQLGTIYERKNPIFTLIAFEKFLNSHDLQKIKAELIFVGARNANKNEISYLKKLRAKITARGLTRKVKLLDTSLSPEKYISKASLITLHSVSECTPTVYLEANYLGKPVVASDVGGVREIVEDGINGYLFKYGDIEKQAELFYRIYKRGTQNMPRASLLAYYKKHFSNKRILHKILKNIERL